VDKEFSILHYLFLTSNPVKHWPMSVVCDVEDAAGSYKAALTSALETGPYGRCVYDCDNDVCDSQMANIQFETGAVANLTMTAFTKEICERYTRITGSKGEIKWEGSAEGPIIVYDFLTRTEKHVEPDLGLYFYLKFIFIKGYILVAPPARTCGHGGADFFLMNSFTKAVALNDPSLIKSGPGASLASHQLVFSAEKSRLSNCVIKMNK